ncbi:MAG: hypothetical protein B7Z26_01200 [Asticcacaulis sp. 32-58-5]|nr:MAG: hypothetical protein B7Z26_01200 [Asticcacaulis sp. 32-58-5]
MADVAFVPCLDCDYRLDDGFRLDTRIEASSLFIAHLNLCQVRVQNDRRFPWLVLVPTIANLKEITELSDAQLMDLMGDIRTCERLVRALADHCGFRVDKLNIANLGNIVAQLHIHVIARHNGDMAWPGPVWGFGQGVALDDPAQTVTVLRAAL